jgi:hypothetical protein
VCFTSSLFTYKQPWIFSYIRYISSKLPAKQTTQFARQPAPKETRIRYNSQLSRQIVEHHKKVVPGYWKTGEQGRLLGEIVCLRCPTALTSTLIASCSSPVCISLPSVSAMMAMQYLQQRQKG